MKKLRVLLISLIILFGLFFNVERLDVGNETVINIQSFVYGLGLLAAIAILCFPALWRDSLFMPLVLFLTVYLISKLFVFNERPLIGSVYTYLTVTEVSFLSLIIWLSYQIGQSIHQVEENVLSFTNKLLAKKLPSTKKSKRIIRTEITRCRHYERPMSLITIYLGQESWQKMNQVMLQEIQKQSVKQYAKIKMANTIRHTLRRMDTVLDMKQENGLMILCPEVDETGAIALKNHVEAEIERHLKIDVTTNSVTFPADGVTFSALIEKVTQKSRVKKVSRKSGSSSEKRQLNLQE